jgi:hypothetical protein
MFFSNTGSRSSARAIVPIGSANSISAARVQLPEPPQPTVLSLARDFFSLRGRVDDGISKEIHDLNARLVRMMTKLYALEDLQAIQNLLLRFTVVHDECVTAAEKREEWLDLFMPGAVTTFPFGTHTGLKGKDKWAFVYNDYFKHNRLFFSPFDVHMNEQAQFATANSRCLIFLAADGTSDRAQRMGRCSWQLSKASGFRDGHYGDLWNISRIEIDFDESEEVDIVDRAHGQESKRPEPIAELSAGIS